jgi:dihydroorotate dehydrogenase
MEAEAAHDLALEALEVASLSATGVALVRGLHRHADARLEVDALGLRFPNPLGVAAGLDKDARAFPALCALGFGHVEVGTITPRPQAGNPRPRVFRLRRDAALVNRMGFPGEGAAAAAARLARLRPHVPPGHVVGVNLGKNRDTDLARALDDHLAALRVLHRHAEHVVVNVSSPNTPGLRSLQDPASLRGLVEGVVAEARRLAGAERARPVLVKLAPDLDEVGLDAALDAALEAGASGFVLANTTLDRPMTLLEPRRAEAGGLSGAPLLPRTVALVRHAFRRLGGRAPIVGVGGVMDAEGAWRVLRAGASLVQVYTGLVYGGPGLARAILAGLSARIEELRLASVADAVGADA